MDSLIAIGSGAALAYGTYILFAVAAAQGRGDMTTVHDLLESLYFESAAMILTLITLGVLTSYSIHYTKLYDAMKCPFSAQSP